MELFLHVDVVGHIVDDINDDKIPKSFVDALFAAVT